MSGHNAAFELGQPQEGVEFDGRFLSFWSGVPTDAVAGYGKGALAVDTTNGKLYINTDSTVTATWTLVGP